MRWPLFRQDPFYIEVDQRRYFRWAGFTLQNCQGKNGLYLAMMKEGNKCDYLIATVLSSKTVWELAINTGSLFPLFLCGRREGAWNLICLNKWCDLQEVQSFQPYIMLSVQYNVYHKICTWVYIFLPGCRAITSCYANTILCVNFFNCNFMCEFFKLNSIIIFHVDICCFLCFFVLICFQLSESVNHPSDWMLA